MEVSRLSVNIKPPKQCSATKKVIFPISSEKNCEMNRSRNWYGYLTEKLKAGCLKAS